MGSSTGSGDLVAPVLIVAATLVAVITVVLARSLAPRHRVQGRPEPSFSVPAVPSQGDGRLSPAQRLAALGGIVLSVAILFLYPWAVTAGAAPLLVLVEAILLLGLIGSGWAYAWRKGTSR